ncbi:MAG: outer membrane lipoprotein-sorting protein [Candidatus Zixiibacteriota bacterium]
MKRLITLLIVVLIGVPFLSSGVSAQDAAEIMQKSHIAYYYAGDDGMSQVTMRLINSKGKERIREFVMLRMDVEDGGDQKYYTYFKKPSDVARMTFMVHKSSGGNDQRWIYIPSIDLIKPISADDKNSSFVGSDFSYEDVSGRHWTEDNHKLVSESELDGKRVWVIESVPIKEYKGFARKLSYIDQATYLPLKEEYFDKKDEMVKLFRADKIEDIDGIQTITSRSMEDLKKNQKTIVEFSSIAYNVGLGEDIFTERFLKNPPREFIQ